MRSRTSKNNLLLLVILMIGFISLGYALLTTNINITGTGKIKDAKWDVHFANIQVTDGSVTPTTAANITDDTSVEFAVTLEKPGDFYEFTIDVVNEGTIDAMVDNFSATPTVLPDCFSYTVTWSNGEVPKDKDGLSKGKTYQMKVRVEMLKDINAGQLLTAEQTLTLSVQLNCVQATDEAEYTVPQARTLNGIMKAAAESDAGIDFSQAPVAGVYAVNSTMSDTNPIYYYRGAVTNNNVLFADKCWKIVRTTETGGVKLIYNGTPTEGKCLGTNPTIGSSAFNTNYNTANDVRYIYGDGTDSKIKGVIDTWYENNLASYESKLEDTPWCMNLSVSSTSGSNIYYGARGRNVDKPIEPSVTCPAEYQLKVSATDVGLKLKHPIALLTADEATLAGSGWYNYSGYSEDAYLNIGSWWWALSPGGFNSSFAYVFFVYSDGYLGYYSVSYTGGVRPAVSLVPGTELTGSGDGTKENPYIVQ